MANNFVIIDGNSVLHRGFHAMPNLTNKKGEAVGAVYGFLLALFKAVEDFRPKYLAVCFDTKAPTFRHQEFKNYKSQRPKTPEILITQLETTQHLLEEMGIKVFAQDGFEADDLIASIIITATKDANYRETNFYILTGDYDSLQLVSDNVKSFIVNRGVKNAIMFDTVMVKREFGINPCQMPDYKALAGDSSDNIPGAPGIGPKAARQILQKFANLEELYSAIEENPNLIITGNNNGEHLKAILLENKEKIMQFKKLTTMRTDASIEQVFENCRFNNFLGEKPKTALLNLGLASLAKRLPLNQTRGNGTLF